MNIGFAFEWRHLHWWLGWAVVAIGAVALGLWLLEVRRRNRLARFAEAKLIPRLLPGYQASVRRPLAWLTLIGCVGLALAFAQPHWGQSWREIHRRSRDIIVVLDTSESMRAANPLPNRLERAKQKIVTLLDRAPGDRFALVAFSGAAELECPLTLDHGYVKSVLSAIDTDTIGKEGTDIAAGLAEAVDVFRKEDESTGLNAKATRAILLISDGEQVSGDAVNEAERAADYARVFVIGVGDPRGAEVMLPDWMGRYVKAMDGDKPHLSKLDEDTLSRIAMAGNGAYVRARVDTWDAEQILERFEELSARDVGSDVRLRLVNRYQLPLLLAILAFAGEGSWLVLLPWVRRRRMERNAQRNEARDYA